ncbi:MAG TPA: PAS domain-containing sensor histidine kinase [Desulfobacterales bacterium]|nr:PAS domain-containing sensor histidine kinase [Desulfobacterales bacterium]
MQDEKDLKIGLLDELIHLRLQIAELEKAQNDLDPSQLALLKAHAELAKLVDEQTFELAVANSQLKAQLEECERIEEALREGEKKYRNLFDNSPIGLGLVDKNGRLILFNNALLQPGGYRPEDITELNTIDFCYMRWQCLKILLIVRDQGFIDEAEIRFKRKDGTPYDALLSLRSVQVKGKPCWHVMVQDVTKRRQAEEALHESSAQIQTLSQQLLKAHENERQRLSFYLHDRLANDLSALILGFETLLYNHPEVSDDIRKEISEFSGILEESLKIVRDISYELSPACLEQIGLVKAIFRYCEDFSEKTGLSVDFFSAGIMDDLAFDFDTRINLYRVVQESLNNIKKHAEAGNVKIRLTASFPKIILRIEDDGKGFDPEKRMAAAIEEKRMGLQSMQERARLLSGTFKIRSQPGAGTKILIEIPYTRGGGIG